jgi:hypothetical protein
VVRLIHEEALRNGGREGNPRTLVDRVRGGLDAKQEFDTYEIGEDKGKEWETYIVFDLIVISQVPRLLIAFMASYGRKTVYSFGILCCCFGSTSVSMIQKS